MELLLHVTKFSERINKNAGEAPTKVFITFLDSENGTKISVTEEDRCSFSEESVYEFKEIEKQTKLSEIEMAEDDDGNISSV